MCVLRIDVGCDPYLLPRTLIINFQTQDPGSGVNCRGLLASRFQELRLSCTSASSSVTMDIDQALVSELEIARVFVDAAGAVLDSSLGARLD